MPAMGPQPPERPKILYRCLFGHGDRATTLSRIADGVTAIVGNTRSLLEDATLLAGAKRYDRAEFLAATAREEMGKLYILIDMCRVDFKRREDIARKLCKGFYRHEIKHAYHGLCSGRYAGILDLAEVKRLFNVMTKRWWPGSYEDGEPDMPSEVYFFREANLYVDFDDYAEEWSSPISPAKSLLFEQEIFGTPVTHACQALDAIEDSAILGLFEPDNLAILNTHFSGSIIDERTDMETLRNNYGAVGAELLKKTGVKPDQFEQSVVHNWPLYSFL